MVREKCSNLDFKLFYLRCIEGKRRDPFRIISIYFSYPLYKAGISANVVTYLTILLNLTIPLLFLLQNKNLFIFVIIYHAFFNPILDSMNGNLARAYGVANYRGALLDLTSDYIGKIMFMALFGIFIFKYYNDNIILYLMLLSFISFSCYNTLYKASLIVLARLIEKTGDISLVEKSIGKPGDTKRITITDIFLYFFTQSTGQAIMFSCALFLDILTNIRIFVRFVYVNYSILYTIASIIHIQHMLNILGGR